MARQVASGSATQGLWLGNKKVGSQMVDVDQCRPLNWKVRRGVRASNSAEETID